MNVAVFAWRSMPAVRLAVALLLVLAVAAQPTRAEFPSRYRIADLKALETAFVELAQDLRPSVVAIRTYYVHRLNDGGPDLVKTPVSQGSGVIIDENGYVATNKHVLEEPANNFVVILDGGQKLEAQLQQSDVRSDLAVLKVDAANLKAVRWGDLENVRVNQWTMSVGNPFGMGNADGNLSVGLGTVTALGRSLTDRLADDSRLQYYGNLIETSSPINPGNSGGPLFDVDGRLIGIVTAIETSTGANEGAGFAIPITRHTRQILDILKDGRRVEYGYLGIRVQDVDSSGARRVVDGRVYHGALIQGVELADGPAARGGLKAKDIIIEVDGVPVKNSDHLTQLVSHTPAGENTVITYMRRGVKRKTTVQLGDRYKLLGVVEDN